MAGHAAHCWVAGLAAGFLAIGSLPAAAHELSFKHLTILHPYTIEPVERLPQEVAIYMKIGNAAAEADRLIGVESKQATSAVLVVRSPRWRTPRPVRSIVLPANVRTTLGPKSAHVLLRDLKEAIDGYQYFPLTLVFEKAGKVEIEVFVEDRN
jgi:periplasmic copper chaperone A